MIARITSHGVAAFEMIHVEGLIRKSRNDGLFGHWEELVQPGFSNI